ncbi:hypothetical protein KDH_23410 [Dictyobacter sp. S3.2.2.5]|uniref:Pyrrolo-quinoline quinone repeat domain-containing protein n=1 Tax=Dictyobacter halimunensis TaxID=3026934 RepID=A0ABQ6FP85_9CHLR|nr:hypothetical protein KDH_23410 [Dictyobacter sp. S3.2.2.5]
MFNDPKTDQFTPQTVDEQIEQPANQQLVEALRLMHQPAPSENDRASLLRVQQQLRQCGMGDAADRRPGKLYVLSPRTAQQRQPHRTRRVSPVLASLVALLLLGILVGMFAIRAHTPQVATPPNAVAPAQNNLYTLADDTLTKLSGQNGATIWRQTVPHPQSLSDYAPYSHLEVRSGTVYAIFDDDLYALRAADGRIIWHTHVSTVPPVYTVIDGTGIYNHLQDGTFVAYSTRDGARQWYNTSFHTAIVHLNIMAFQVQHGSVYIHSEHDQQGYLSALDSVTGSVRWSRLLSSVIPGSPLLTLDVNGTVYCIASNYLYALNEQTGQIQWRQQSLEPAQFTQLYLVNGIVYTVTGNTWDGDESGKRSRVYAFDASSGKPLWVTPIGYGLLSPDGDVYPIASTTLLSQHGYLFVNANMKNGHSIQALNAKDGKVAWQVDVPMPTAVVSGRIANGILYVSNGNVEQPRQLASIDPRAGKQLASHKPVSSYKYTWIAGGDAQHLYLGMGSDSANIQAFASVRLSDGTLVWQKRLNPPASPMYEVIMAP